MIYVTVSCYDSVTGAITEKCQRGKMNDSKSTKFVGSCFYSKVQWCNVQSVIALFYQLLVLFSIRYQVFSIRSPISRNKMAYGERVMFCIIEISQAVDLLP